MGDSVEFFFYDTAKILLLLVLMVYVIGWLRAAMHVERVRDYLAGKGRGMDSHQAVIRLQSSGMTNRRERERL